MGFNSTVRSTGCPVYYTRVFSALKTLALRDRVDGELFVLLFNSVVLEVQQNIHILVQDTTVTSTTADSILR